MAAVRELVATLVDGWEAADLVERLVEWWWVVRHPGLVDDGISQEIGG